MPLSEMLSDLKIVHTMLNTSLSTVTVLAWQSNCELKPVQVEEVLVMIRVILIKARALVLILIEVVNIVHPWTKSVTVNFELQRTSPTSNDGPSEQRLYSWPSPLAVARLSFAIATYFWLFVF